MGLMDRFPLSKGERMLATSKEWERQGHELLSLVSAIYLKDFFVR